MDSMTLVFVYVKGNKIKCFSLNDSKLKHKKLIKKGWEHKSTINASIFMENIHNNCTEKEILQIVKDLKN